MLTPLEFQRLTGVSRETLDKFTTYEALVRKWQGAINLVGVNTLNDIWGRHFYDSAQIFPLIKSGQGLLIDLGSGAGFPGLVLALMGIKNMHLIESDQRKATFLKEAARSLELSVTIHAKRIEDVEIKDPVDYITARALAPLNELIGHSHKWLEKGATGLFLKGKNSTEEVKEAKKKWPIEAVEIASKTDPNARIIQIKIIA